MSESSSWPWWAFPVFFAALWLAIFHLISRWGGWSALARAYPAPGIPVGERFRMRSAQLRGGCNYNNCITFVSGPTGLQMSLPFPFNFHHPPVFIPWTELQAHEERAWLSPVVVLKSLRCPNIPIKLHRRLADRMLAAGGSQLSTTPLGGGESSPKY